MTDKKLMIMQGEVETHKQNYSHAQKQIQELERKVCVVFYSIALSAR